MIMERLSTIFENIHNDDSMQLQFFVDRISDYLILKENNIHSNYSLGSIENHIVSEAMKKPTLEESLRFVDNFNKRLDEGFVNSVVQSTINKVKAAKDRVKGKVVDAWKGSIITAIKKWNTSVTISANRLDGLSENLDVNNNYLFESEGLEIEGNSNQNPYIQLLTKLTTVTNENIVRSKLPLNTLRYFQITRDGSWKVLSLGIENALVPVIKWKKNTSTVIIIIPPTFKLRQLNVLTKLINHLSTVAAFGLEDVITEVSTSSGKITVSTNSRSVTGSTKKHIKITDAGVRTINIDIPSNQSDGAISSHEVNKSTIMAAIDASHVKDNTDNFYNTMGVTPDVTWASFKRFAHSFDYKITDILRNSTGDINGVKHYFETTPTYIAYLANMGRLITALKEQPVPPEYNTQNYLVFLNTVLNATGDMEHEVNRNLTEKTVKKQIYLGDEAQNVSQRLNASIINNINNLSANELHYVLTKVEEV